MKGINNELGRTQNELTLRSSFQFALVRCFIV